LATIDISPFSARGGALAETSSRTMIIFVLFLFILFQMLVAIGFDLPFLGNTFQRGDGIVWGDH
jgi:hypothetical protein